VKFVTEFREYFLRNLGILWIPGRAVVAMWLPKFVQVQSQPEMVPGPI
jgi:hypothetical protein